MVYNVTVRTPVIHSCADVTGNTATEHPCTGHGAHHRQSPFNILRALLPDEVHIGRRRLAGRCRQASRSSTWRFQRTLRTLLVEPNVCKIRFSSVFCRSGGVQHQMEAIRSTTDFVICKTGGYVSFIPMLSWLPVDIHKAFVPPTAVNLTVAVESGWAFAICDVSFST